MSEDRRRKLKELAQKFKDSAGIFRKNLIRAKQQATIFTYLEYLEFSAEEFHKFKYMEPISDKDIDDVDWEVLSDQLLA